MDWADARSVVSDSDLLSVRRIQGGEERLTEQVQEDPVTKIFRDAAAQATEQVTEPTQRQPEKPSTQAAVTTPTVTKPAPKPHSAYFVFRMLGPEAQGGEAFKRVAPGLRAPRAHEGMILLALVVLSAVITSFGGIAIYGAVHPPIQLVGSCIPPAQISGGDCVIAETQTGQDGKPVTVYIPTGTVYFLNGTRYRGR